MPPSASALAPAAPRSPARKKAQAAPPQPPPPPPALSEELPWGDLSLNKCLVLASLVALLGSAFQLCRGEPGRRPGTDTPPAPARALCGVLPPPPFASLVWGPTDRARPRCCPGPSLRSGLCLPRPQFRVRTSVHLPPRTLHGRPPPTDPPRSAWAARVPHGAVCRHLPRVRGRSCSPQRNRTCPLANGIGEVWRTGVAPNSNSGDREPLPRARGSGRGRI